MHTRTDKERDEGRERGENGVHLICQGVARKHGLSMRGSSFCRGQVGAQGGVPPRVEAHVRVDLQEETLACPQTLRQGARFAWSCSL